MILVLPLLLLLESVANIFHLGENALTMTWSIANEVLRVIHLHSIFQHMTIFFSVGGNIITRVVSLFERFRNIYAEQKLQG